MLKLKLEEITEKETSYLLRKLEQLEPERPYNVYVLRAEEKRSLPQLRYYWGVVVKEISEASGETRERIHLYNKHTFGLRVTSEIGGIIIEEIKGTKVSKKELTEFIDKVAQFWSEQLGITISTPGGLSQAEYIQAYNDTTFEND